MGGTAAALHAGHRRSHDADHVLEDLRERFDHVLAHLERAAGWQTERGLTAPWNDWDHVTTRGRRLAPVVASTALQEPP